MREVSNRPKVSAPWWIWLTLVVPLGFMAWSVWMLLVVQEFRQQDAGRVAAMAKLESLERALIELQQSSIVLWRTPVASNSAVRWRELYKGYRDQVRQLDAKVPEIRDVMDHLLRLYAAVGRTERIRQQLLMTKVPEEEARALEAEFHSKTDVALAELKEAMLKVRMTNAASDDLPLWTGFAVASGGVAVLMALLLLTLGRQIGRVTAAETELAANWRDVRAVEARWQTFLNAAPDAFLATDGKGVVQAANIGVQNLLGYAPADLAGRTLSAVLPALTRRKESENPEFAWVETEARRRDGSLVVLDVTVRKTVVNGEPVTLALLRPAGKGRVEESLRGERDFMNSIFEAADVMLAVLDERGRIIGANTSLERKSGLPPAKVKGKVLQEVFPIEPLPGSPAAFPVRKGLCWLEKLGLRRRVVWLGAELIGKSGVIQHVVALGVDITDYLGALAPPASAPAEPTAGVMDRLAVKVAQTLSDSLTTISGYSELLLDSLKPEAPARRDIEQILDASQRACAVTRSLLSFSERQILQPETLDLNARIDALKKRLCAALGKGVVLIIELDKSLEPVSVDPDRFDEMLLILARNAGEAMPGGGKVTIQTVNAAASRDGAWVTVSMRDTGTGIDEQTQKRLFEPFFTTKDPRKALGLGLATVRGIAAQSGGHVRVETAPGMGANISILLPPVGKPVAHEPVEAGAALPGQA